MLFIIHQIASIEFYSDYLDFLSDTDISTEADNQILAYSSDKWINRSIGLGFLSNVSTLRSDGSDAIDKDVFQYNGTDWEAAPMELKLINY